MNSRMGTSMAETSCPCSTRVRRGPHSVLSPPSSGKHSHQHCAGALASWLEQARSSQRAETDLANVRTAIELLRKAGQEIREDRMAQATETSAKVWAMLRQESNVELVSATLECGADAKGEK